MADGSHVIALIQARMGSTRFPGKVLEDLEGTPVLGWLVSRASASRCLDDVVVATSDTSEDGQIEEWCRRHGVAVVRGPEKDVLARFRRGARAADASVIVRLTADCPLLDSETIGRAVRAFRADPAVDCVRTGKTYPEGYGVEVFSRETLKKIDQRARSAADREHVTRFIYENKERFEVRNLELEEDYSDLRVTVDYPEDLARVRRVVREVEGTPETVTFTEVVEVLRRLLAESPRHKNRVD